MKSWEDFWGDALEWMVVKVFVPMVVIAVIAIPAALIWGSCTGKFKDSVCQHQPHMGKCKVQVTTYYYDANLKMMTPMSSDCGCISDHGVVVAPRPN